MTGTAETAQPPEYAVVRKGWADLPDEQLLDVRFNELGLQIEGSWLEARVASLREELHARGLTFRAALLALERMVHARRRARDRHPVLPGASPAHAARERADARSRRRHAGVVHADSAARGGPRLRQRVRPAQAATPGARLRIALDAVPRFLSSEAGTRRASSCTWTRGTRRATRTRTLPRPSRSGSRPTATGASATPTGPR